MNSTLSRWAAANGPFRQATLTFSGMLLCLFASVVGLVAVSADQTGLSTAAVKEEFCNDRGSEKSLGALLEFSSVRREEKQVDEQKRRRLEEEQLFSIETEADPSRDESQNAKGIDPINGFANFVRELDRIGSGGTVQLHECSFVVDVMSSRTLSDGERAKQLVSLLRRIEGSSSADRSRVEYRLTLWSPTPSIDAVLVTTERAKTLEEMISLDLDAIHLGDVKVAVECCCWMLPDAPRPDYSVQTIRR